MMALSRTSSLLACSHQGRKWALPAPAHATRQNALFLRVQQQERRLSVRAKASSVSPAVAELRQQSDAAGWARPAREGIQQQKRRADASNTKLKKLQDAYEQHASAVESEGLLSRSFVDWVHAVQVEQAWRQRTTTAAVLDVAKGSIPCTKLPCSRSLPGHGLWAAGNARQHAAHALAHHVLQALNNGNTLQGLFWDSLPAQLQCPIFNILNKLGCVDGWGQPQYRQLPQTARGMLGTLQAGQRVTLGLQEYIALKTQHERHVVYDELHDTWDGRVEVYVHPQQFVNCWEVAKVLDDSMLAQFVGSGRRNGLTLRLFDTAKRLGIADCHAAAMSDEGIGCGMKNLHELLLFKMHRALHAVSIHVLLQLREKIHPSYLVSIAASSTSVAGNSNVFSSSSSVMTSSACGCGGCGRGRGSLTAVGADDLNGSAADSVVVVGLKQSERDGHNVQLTASPLSLQTPAAGAAAFGGVASGQRSSNGSRNVVWLRRGLSVFKRWRKSA